MIKNITLNNEVEVSSELYNIFILHLTEYLLTTIEKEEKEDE